MPDSAVLLYLADSRRVDSVDGRMFGCFHRFYICGGTDHIVDCYEVHGITIVRCDIESIPIIGVCVVALSADSQGDAEVEALVDNTGEIEDGVGIEPCPFGGCHSL
jgi:hypothetical protein